MSLPKDQQIHLNAIKEIRAVNNDLWMKILEVAMEHAPDQTKAILRTIQRNDEAISMLTADIVDDNKQEEDRSEPPAIPYSRGGR